MYEREKLIEGYSKLKRDVLLALIKSSCEWMLKSIQENRVEKLFLANDNINICLMALIHSGNMYKGKRKSKTKR